MRSKTSQTATEYLVILGVVIFIAVITVTAVSDVVAIGSSGDEQTARLTLATQTIAFTDYFVSDYETVFFLSNNYKNPIEITSIELNGETCNFFFSSKPRIGSGSQKKVVCQNIFSYDESSVEWLVQINYTDTKTQANFSQDGDNLYLISSVGQSYLDTLTSNVYWNASIDGCYDASIDPVPICTCVDLNKTRNDPEINITLQNSIDFNRCKQEFGIDFVSGQGWDPIDFPSEEHYRTF